MPSTVAGAVVALAVSVLVASCVVPPAAGILGNSVFDSVRNATESFGDRHDALFNKFLACNFSRNYSWGGQRHGRPEKLYILQDGSGGGGIGNLILKINAVVSFAITNGLEYLLPPLLPYGHGDAELYKDFFDHAAHDVAMRAATVIQLQCPMKYKSVKGLVHHFPLDMQPWWELGGVNDFEQAKWGGPDNKRCLPTDVMANCDELRPPHVRLGRIANHTAAAYSTALVVRMPGSLHYHTNFSLSAPLFRQAYANRQARLFRAAWAPLIAEHDETRRNERCDAVTGKGFAVIGVHVRLGDVVAKFDLKQRAKRAAAPKSGNWGGKLVSPEMHLSGLDLVLREIDPACSKVIVVTDGDRDSPEIQYFFEHAAELPGWNASLRHRPACLDVQHGHTPLNCDVLFFGKDSVTSLDALNLLAYADIIVASGSQFSRVAAMMGGAILLNPNFGFEARKQVIIPARRPVNPNRTLSPKPLQKLQMAERRFHHLWQQRLHKERQRLRDQEAAAIARSNAVAEVERQAEENVRTRQAVQETLSEEEAELERKAAQLRAENEAIKQRIREQQLRGGSGVAPDA